jgi:hypothetical protein
MEQEFPVNVFYRIKAETISASRLQMYHYIREYYELHVTHIKDPLSPVQEVFLDSGVSIIDLYVLMSFCR